MPKERKERQGSLTIEQAREIKETIDTIRGGLDDLQFQLVELVRKPKLKRSRLRLVVTPPFCP